MHDIKSHKCTDVGYSNTIWDACFIHSSLITDFFYIFCCGMLVAIHLQQEDGMDMNSNFLKNKIGGAILMFSILLGVGIATSTTVQAQWQQNDRYSRDREREQREREREARRNQRRSQRDQDRYGRGRNNSGYYGGTAADGYSNLGGSYQLRQTALNEGFNQGLKEGRRDRSRNEYQDWRDEDAYRNATESYSSKLGDKELYRRYFREAFENGYKDGYAGY